MGKNSQGSCWPISWGIFSFVTACLSSAGNATLATCCSLGMLASPETIDAGCYSMVPSGLVLEPASHLVLCCFDPTPAVRWSFGNPEVQSPPTPPLQRCCWGSGVHSLSACNLRLCELEGPWGLGLVHACWVGCRASSPQSAQLVRTVSLVSRPLPQHRTQGRAGMSRKVCAQLVCAAFSVGLVTALVQMPSVSHLYFSDPTVAHFFGAILPAMKCSCVDTTIHEANDLLLPTRVKVCVGLVYVSCTNAHHHHHI